MSANTPSQANGQHRNSLSRRIGQLLGLLYLLITLLFGPIKSLAVWLGRQQIIQRYQQWVSDSPPAVGLSLSLSSLFLLELSKILVLLTFQRGGLVAAAMVTLLAKASVGYFAHTTWHAARPKAIAHYAWVARVDRWIGIQLTKLRVWRDRRVQLTKRYWRHFNVSNALAKLKKWFS
ncbi:MAG: hypothetical protein ABTR07_17845 [Candidatus Competibacter denitrificans]